MLSSLGGQSQNLGDVHLAINGLRQSRAALAFRLGVLLIAQFIQEGL